jgi:hypothetical protein
MTPEEKRLQRNQRQVAARARRKAALTPEDRAEIAQVRRIKAEAKKARERGEA